MHSDACTSVCLQKSEIPAFGKKKEQRHPFALDFIDALPDVLHPIEAETDRPEPWTGHKGGTSFGGELEKAVEMGEWSHVG